MFQPVNGRQQPAKAASPLGAMRWVGNGLPSGRSRCPDDCRRRKRRQFQIGAEILSDIIGVDQLTAPELRKQTVYLEVLLVGIAEAVHR